MTIFLIQIKVNFKIYAQWCLNLLLFIFITHFKIYFVNLMRLLPLPNTYINKNWLLFFYIRHNFGISFSNSIIYFTRRQNASNSISLWKLVLTFRFGSITTVNQYTQKQTKRLSILLDLPYRITMMWLKVKLFWNILVI